MWKLYKVRGKQEHHLKRVSDKALIAKVIGDYSLDQAQLDYVEIDGSLTRLSDACGIVEALRLVKERKTAELKAAAS